MIKIFKFNSNLKISKNNKYNLVNDIKDTFFVFLNYKIRSKKQKIKKVNENNIPIVTNALELCRKHDKILVYQCCGDSPPVILPNVENVYVLNTSVKKKGKPSNEIVIGVNIRDKFKFYLLNPKLSIGFVGQKGHKVYNREKYLNFLSNSEISTDFIIRDSFILKLRQKHINDFENNMNNNLFTFCYRGRGNFSVRFFETLMRGRIPIVIKTNSEFPFEKWIDYNKVGLFINEEELKKNMNLDKLIIDYFKNKTKEELINIQKNNRKIYLTYFSNDVFYEKIFEYIYYLHSLKNKNNNI